MVFGSPFEEGPLVSAVDALGIMVMAFIAVAAVRATYRRVVRTVRDGLREQARTEAHDRRRAAYDAAMEQTVPLPGGDR